MICNVALVSAVQQRESFMHIHISTLFFSHVGRYRLSSRVHCAIQLLFSCSVVSDSFATPWTVFRQAPLSIGFSRQEYWSGLPFLKFVFLMTGLTRTTLFIAGRSVLWIINNVLELRLDTVNGSYSVRSIILCS